MKILSYNFLAGGFRSYEDKAKKPEKFDELVKAVKEVNADVVSLIDTYHWERIFTTGELLQKFGYKKGLMVQVSDDKETDPVSKSGIMVMTNLPAKFTKLQLYKRNAIKTKIGRTEIISAYFDALSEDLRLAQAKTLWEKYIDKKVPTVVTGDLNSIDKSEINWLMKVIVNLGKIHPAIKEYVPIVEEMMRAQVIDFIKSSGFTDADPLKRQTIPSKLFVAPVPWPVFRFDYLFHNQKIKIKKFEVLRNKTFEKLSDHYPILIEIELQSATDETKD